MSERVDKTASLAIAEKKPQRPGGCAGIFFQLFNWNKSFSKKKLFSNQLLPPAHPKQCAGKFGGDEKLPKHRLIANENSGGFPYMKKNGNYNNDSKQKPQMRPPSLVARLMGLESMPAIQKIKSSQESPIFHTNIDEKDKFTNFQNVFESNMENRKIKNESRPQKVQKTEPYEKQALTKFTSEAFQFKSVLSRSKKNNRPKLNSPLKSPRMSSARTSRLMDVASKILEPGLQNTNRAKNAITYSSTVSNSNENRNYFATEQKIGSQDILISSEQILLKAQPCKHCGSQVEPRLDEKPLFFSNCSNPNVEEIKRGQNGPPIFSYEQEKWRVSEKYQEVSTLPISQSRKNKKLFIEEDQIEAQYKSSQRVPKYSSSQKTHRQSQVSTVRDRMPPNRVNNVNRSKEFNSKLPTKINNVTRNEEINFCNKRGGSLSPVRKRRSMSGAQDGEISNFSVGEREIKLDSRSFNSNHRGSKMVLYGEKYKNKNNNVNSIAFDSSAKQKMVKANAEKLIALNGDELGALLQKKLRDLSGDEEDEMAIENSEPKRSTAIILQELISALNAEKSIISKSMDVDSEDKAMCNGAYLSNKRFNFEAKQNAAITSSAYIHEGEYFSPGSILEASFSNDSCLSSSFGDGSASINQGCSNIQLLIDLVSHIFEILISLGFANTNLKRSNLDYAKEVILNTELIFKDSKKSLSISHFLVCELENLASAMWADFGYLLGYKHKKNENQIKEFVFDCVTECLDTRYIRYSSCGFEEWKKMPHLSTANEFVADLVREFRGWMGFAEYSLDEIIEFEMSHNYGKWRNFEMEVYETGSEIEKDVLQLLVDEIVVDLFEGKMCYGRI